jgi:hypothetical protein
LDAFLSPSKRFGLTEILHGTSALRGDRFSKMWELSQFNITNYSKLPEIVDGIAKEHSSSTQYAYTSPIALDFNPRLKTLMLSKWQSRWESGDMGRYTFSIYPQVGLRPWFLGLEFHF